MRVLLVVVLLTSFTFLPAENNKDYSNNFELCRKILYTSYPKEINPKEWRMCMSYET
tara:strand:- start:875 stop:1045 length:171 start_codon:yes stop_codon:yes gene_type:complete